MEEQNPKITIFDTNKATHFFTFDTSVGDVGSLYQINVPANEDYVKALNLFPGNLLGELAQRIKSFIKDCSEEEFSYLLTKDEDGEPYIVVSFIWDSLTIYVNTYDNKGRYQIDCQTLYHRIIDYLNNVEVKISFGPN